ncbi:hypothetical protein [Paractinoplanes durhamensis]|uniref:Uncharacterized protein n=1 Tax=Paractinoplanes durhamensis TaxID=113563 RepID=A0ABQ3YR82_9ACTN|nr:hypothetical protein [Actinoplanes durhamensis]GIE00051.1 hypothetical protein Adu01nite_14010 [Actinoplanes durhamensis]
MTARTTIVTGTLLGLAMLAAGCGGGGGGGGAADRSAGAPVVQARWESCAADGPRDTAGLGGSTDALTLLRLDDSFAPVAAVICRTAPFKRPGGGEDLTAEEVRAGDVTALLPTLRLPDEEPTAGACTADLVLVPWLVLLDADGRWIRPGVPVDSCSKPRREFRDAVAQLKTETVAKRTLQNVESDEAATAGCSQQWADMLWVIGQNGAGNADPHALAADDAAASLCVYRVPASEQGSDKPAGDFVSGGKLAPATWVALKRELAGAAPAGPCTTPASRFAVVHTPAGEIYVEADGCKRAMIGDARLVRTTPEVAALLF